MQSLRAAVQGARRNEIYYVAPSSLTPEPTYGSHYADSFTLADRMPSAETILSGACRRGPYYVVQFIDGNTCDSTMPLAGSPRAV